MANALIILGGSAGSGKTTLTEGLDNQPGIITTLSNQGYNVIELDKDKYALQMPGASSKDIYRQMIADAKNYMVASNTIVILSGNTTGNLDCFADLINNQENASYALLAVQVNCASEEEQYQRLLQRRAAALDPKEFARDDAKLKDRETYSADRKKNAEVHQQQLQANNGKLNYLQVETFDLNTQSNIQPEVIVAEVTAFILTNLAATLRTTPRPAFALG